MKRTCVLTTLVLLLALITPASANRNRRNCDYHNEVKYVIFMVPDGMGLADVTAARLRKNGPSGAPLALETLDEIGYQRTYSADNTITDSAAAASAWACGEKFANGEICLHASGEPNNLTLLELAKLNGMATGLVATSTITHATPAVFGAHVASRSCENEIARQYIHLTQPDVILGGGVNKFNSVVADKCGAAGNYMSDALSRGYRVALTKDELNTEVARGTRKVLGLFSPEGMTPEYQRPANSTEPRLPEMTAAALRIMERQRHRNGFFLMIEGSQIDWGNHANNLEYQIGETLAFDEAVNVVLDWIDAKAERREHTLLIIAPDHETGGFAVNGNESVPNLGPFQAGWTTGGHTGGDVMIWSEGPGSKALGRAIENTFVYEVVKRKLR